MCTLGIKYRELTMKNMQLNHGERKTRALEKIAKELAEFGILVKVFMETDKTDKQERLLTDKLHMLSLQGKK